MIGLSAVFSCDVSIALALVLNPADEILSPVVVARYIRGANFKVDSLSFRGRPCAFTLDVGCGGAVVRLAADSSYLE